MELLEPGDAERLGLDPESLEAWTEQALSAAPARTPEHWEALARAAGVSARSPEPCVRQSTSGHVEPCPPESSEVPAWP